MEKGGAVISGEKIGHLTFILKGSVNGTAGLLEDSRRVQSRPAHWFRVPVTPVVLWWLVWVQNELLLCARAIPVLFRPPSTLLGAAEVVPPGAKRRLWGASGELRSVLAQVLPDPVPIVVSTSAFLDLCCGHNSFILGPRL